MVIKYTYSGSYENIKINGIAYVTSGSYTTELGDAINYNSERTIHYPLREENITRIEDHIKGAVEEYQQRDTLYYNQYQDDSDKVIDYTLFSSSLEEA